MKKAAFFCMVLFFCPLMANNEWLAPIFISSGVAPDMDIDADRGVLHFISMVKGALYTRADSVGNILNQEIVPGSYSKEGNIERYDEGGWSMGATVAAGPDGNAHVCYRMMEGFPYFNTYYTFRAGPGSWYRPLQLSFNLLRGFVIRAAVDDDNRVHVGRIASVSEIEGTVYYQRVYEARLNRTESWTDEYRADSRVEIDAAFANQVHLVTACPKTPNGTVRYYVSEDGGSSFTSKGDIRAPECVGRNGSPDIFVDAAGVVHLCYGASVDRLVGEKPSVHYVRFEEGKMVRDIRVTPANALGMWKTGQGWGLGSVAATDDGRTVVVAYMAKDVGKLSAVMSTDGGQNWSDPVTLSNAAETRPDGRSRPVLRAYSNHFYLLYSETTDTVNYAPNNSRIVLRAMRNTGDDLPVADGNGAYYGYEGIPVQLDASRSTDSGVHEGIIRYSWDTNMDGTFEVVTDSPAVWYTFPDDRHGAIVLQVMDRGWQTDTCHVQVNIENVAPVVDAGPNRTCKEGESVPFSCTVTDVRLDTINYIWSFGDGAIGEGATPFHTYRDDGSYRVLVLALDDKGAVSRDSMRMVVQNAPPVAEAGGPYTFPLSEPVVFTGWATDPGVDDILSFNWDLDSDGIFESVGRQVLRKYSRTGTYKIWLMASDGDGGTGFDTASVFIVRDNPTVKAIPNQTVSEGRPFSPIPLDDYVSDPWFKDQDLAWSFRGHRMLVPRIGNDRVFTVAPADSEWSGTETLTLIAANPKQFKDSTRVAFTVTAINDAPRWTKTIPNASFPEDSSLSVPLDSLRVRVTDIDDTTADLRFSITGSKSIRWSLNGERDALILSAPADWYGAETVTAVVTDPGGLGRGAPFRITVWAVPDPPAPFSLISPTYFENADWPDTLGFTWHRSIDVDTVGRSVYYTWILFNGPIGGDLLSQQLVFDTTCQYLPDKLLPKGTYFWKVVATTFAGASTESRSIGILVIGKTGVETPAPPLPDAFQLLQNYPNPFNPETRISYHMPTPNRVRLSIYNSLGKEVRILVEGDRAAGVHQAVWDGKDQGGRKLPSGIYLCRLQAGSEVFLRKMMLMQ